MEFESALIQKAHDELNNYCIEKEEGTPNVSVIYFTSNALYYPNDDKTVEERIFDNNRYEFRHYRREKVTGEIKQEIFVRDVYKQWYLCGINKTVDTVEKLADHLRQLTNGTKVITVGSSAGGFAACLFGMLLSADQIFTFSGQFDLTDEVDTNNEVLWEYRNDKRYTQYFSLIERLKQNSSPIFYFYPSGIEKDRHQNSLTENIDNIYRFCIVSNEHGRTIYDQNIPYVLAMTPDHLIALSKKYEGKRITPYIFSAENMSWNVTARAVIYNISKTAVHTLRKIKRSLTTMSTRS